MQKSNDIRCVAIIPARGGSKGVAHKNLQEVGQIPLVARTILAAQRATLVDMVFVSTDDHNISSVASEYGAKVIIRPEEIAGDMASSEAAITHALNTLKASGVEPELTVFLQCTSPFTTSEAIDSVINSLSDPQFSCAFSVSEDHSFLWGVNELGCGYGVNHDATKPRQRRQDIEKQYRETGAVYAMRTLDFLAKNSRFCGKAKPVVIDLPSIEIDSYQDLEIARALHEVINQKEQKNPMLAGVSALITDFDGVHTDDRVFVDQSGEESVACSRSDGMGIEMLKQAGIQILILSKEANPVVSARAKKLGIEVIQQCSAKSQALEKWALKKSLQMNQIVYMGNDINDLECMKLVGWSCCPADAHPKVKAVANYVTYKKGGFGAIREVADLLIS